MNQRELMLTRRKNWYNYHIPGMTNLHRIKKNAVFIRAHNSDEHEISKVKVCLSLLRQGHEFITEAERNMSKGEARTIVDIINLDTGMEIEIETNKSRAKGLIKEEGVRNVEVKRLWEAKHGGT